MEWEGEEKRKAKREGRFGWEVLFSSLNKALRSCDATMLIMIIMQN